MAPAVPPRRRRLKSLRRHGLTAPRLGYFRRGFDYSFEFDSTTLNFSELNPS